MTALKAHEVERFLRRPDIEAGILLVYGPDTGLVRETAQKLVRYYTGDDPTGMGLATLDGSELDSEPGRLLTEARTSSLFGERRVVRVRGAGKALTVPLSELAEGPVRLDRRSRGGQSGAARCAAGAGRSGESWPRPALLCRQRRDHPQADQ